MSKDEYAVYYGHVQLIYMTHDQTFGSEKRDNIFISTLFLEQLMQNRCFGWVWLFMINKVIGSLWIIQMFIKLTPTQGHSDWNQNMAKNIGPEKHRQALESILIDVANSNFSEGFSYLQMLV